MNKAFLIIISIIAITTSGLIGFSTQYFNPKIKPLIVNEIKKQTQDFVELKLSPKNIHFHWFPISASITNLGVLPKNKIQKFLAPLEIKNILVKLDYLDLLKGNISIKSVDIIDSDVKLIVKKFDQSSEKKLNDLNFLSMIPIEFLNLKNVNFTLRLNPVGISLRAENISAEVENLKNALIAKINSPSVLLKKIDHEKIYKIKLSSSFLIENRRILISDLNLQHTEKTFLDLAGDIQGHWLNNQIKKFNVNSKGNVEIQQITQFLDDFFPKVKKPKASGELQYEVNYTNKSIDITNPKFNINTKDLIVNNINLGNINLSGKINKELLTLKKISAQSKILKITNGDAQINIKNLNDLKSNLTIKGFKLNELLNSLAKKKKTSPVGSQLTSDGTTSCTGSIKPQLQISCRVTTKNTAFDLSNKKTKKNIIYIKNVNSTGDIKITNQFISYEAELSTESGLVSATGKIDYRTGFFVDIDGRIKDVKSDIDNIANLELKGNLQATGRVEGNSKTAEFVSNIDCTDCFIKGWQLGNFKSKLSFVKSVLLFEGMQGQIEQTRHNSSVKVDLNDSTILVNSDLNQVELANIRQAIGTHVNIPFLIEGEGNAKFKLWGPMVLNKLNFDLDAKIGYGFVAQESFDSAHLDINCRNGNIDMSNSFLKKADSTIKFNGGIQRTGELTLSAQVTSLLIKNSELLNKIKFNSSGSLNLSVQTSGTFTQPKLLVDGYMYNSDFGLNNKEDSAINIILQKDRLYAKVSLNKKQFVGELEYPFHENDAQLAINAQNWNFSDLLEGHFPHFKKINVFSNVNGSARLTIPNKNFNQATGQVKINNFHILRGSYSLYLVKKMNLDIKNGQLSDFNTALKGQRTDLKIQSVNSKISNLNLALKGTVDLGIGLIFSSLIEEFKGNTSVSLKIKGPLTQPISNGSVYIQNSILKLKNLSQPITDLNSELTMNNQDLIINQLNGKTGNGDIFINGKVSLNNIEPKLNLKGLVKNVNFSSIEGVNLKLDGDYKLSGTKTPYRLKANFNVIDGQIDKEVTLDQNLKKQKLSKYAPEEFQEKKSNALLLDINLDFEKPIPTRIITTQVDIETSVSGNIQLTQKASDPLLNGRILLDQNSIVKLRNNDYNLTNSSITYKNQKYDDPFINLELDSRVEEYDINIKITGTGQKPKLDFRSSPTLASSEIINLILLGYTSTDIENETGPSDQQNQLAFEASSIILKEKLGLTRGMNDKLGIEVDISSTFNEDQSKPIPVITVKKQLGKNLNTTASRSFEKSATNSVKAEYKLNRNLSIIGSYIREEGKETTSDTDEDGDAFGLDFEYKLEFK